MSYARIGAALLAALSVPAAFAAGPSRYRVAEVPFPTDTAGKCVAGLWASMNPTSLNDLGMTGGGLLCYASYDPAALVVRQSFHGTLSALHFGTTLLAEPPGTQSVSLATIDNRGAALGAISGAAGLSGTRWTLGGGIEDVFPVPGCLGFELEMAVDSSPRGYVVGWTFGSDPTSSDGSCSQINWVIRKPGGEQVFGPFRGSPSRINLFDVAAGEADFGAIRVHVPSGRVRVLKPGTQLQQAHATGIGDLGDVAGFVDASTTSGGFCGASIALRWEPDGRERTLRNLPGAPSSRAHAVGLFGETVGYSGASDYCVDGNDLRQRAVIWHGTQPFDLNALIPANSGVVLTQAVDLNRRGQIVVWGFRPAEPAQPCPQLVFDEVTQQERVDDSLRCVSRHAYVLTPTGR